MCPLNIECVLLLDQDARKFEADAAAGGKKGSKRSRSQNVAAGSLGVGSLDDDGYDDEPVPKVVRAEPDEPPADPATGSLGEGATGQAPDLQGTLGSLGGSLAEDDDYDDF